MTLFNKLAAAVITVGVLSTSVIAADAMGMTDSTTTVKKHHKMHKKVMADSTMTMTTSGADTITMVKKHKKHKKAAMADSSAMAPAAK